jgi:hypothetical protein
MQILVSDGTFLDMIGRVSEVASLDNPVIACILAEYPFSKILQGVYQSPVFGA